MHVEDQSSKLWAIAVLGNYADVQLHIRNDMMLFRLYRNRVNCEAKRLRRAHYEQRLNSICANSGRWWSNVREITGRMNTGCSLQGLANLVCDGSMDALADSINSYLQSVTRDFTPITSDDDFTIGHDTPDHVPDRFIIHVNEVERKLSRINTSHSMGALTPSPVGSGKTVPSC